MTIVVLDSAAEDINAGRNFYDSREPGVGDYFEESILSDLDSLILYAGIHSVHFGFTECFRSDFHSASIMKLKKISLLFTPSWTCDEIRFGFGKSFEDDISPTALTCTL
jgi:hypothetical protein